mgnify:FL=1
MLILDFLGIGEAISNAIRAIFIALDQVVYFFVEVILQLIMDLSRTQIFTQTTIEVFAKRIYVILGLVMVFKMMISFVQILIDPDTMNDKEKGVGAILKRVVISLILIVLVPSIFSTAREIQSYILPVIPKVIMGVDDPEGGNTALEDKVGKMVAWYSFLPFFDYAGTCNDGSIVSYFDDENSPDMSASDVVISSVNDAMININRQDESCGEGDYHYMYEHKKLISTVVGVYLLFTLVQVAIQVAIRAIKLGICEFIAPIPIASYIDPKTSKSTFDKWVNTSIKVYLDLFIQLIVVYFVAFVFTVIVKGEYLKIIVANTGNSFWRSSLVVLFIIIGLFKFVKEFPKFLSDLLGLGTGGAIGEIFKGAWEGAKTTGRFIGGTSNVLRSNYTSQKERALSQGKEEGAAKLAGLKSAVAGLGSYNARVLGGKISGKKGKDLINGAFQGTVSARNRRNYNKDVVFQNGYTKKQYQEERRRQKLGIPSSEDFIIEKHKGFSEMFSATDAAAKHGMSKIYDSPDSLKIEFKDQYGNRIKKATLAQVASLSKRLEGQEYNGVKWTAADVSYWNDNLKRAEKVAQYVKESELITSGDSSAVQNWKNVQEAMKSKFDYFRTDVNGRQAFETFKDSFNGVSDVQINTIDDLKGFLDSSSPTAKQLQALKTANEKLQTESSDEAVAAEKRKKASEIAKQNNSK